MYYLCSGNAQNFNSMIDSVLGLVPNQNYFISHLISFMKILTVSLLGALCLSTPALASMSMPADSVHVLDSVSVIARLRNDEGINPLGVSVKKLPLTISSLADSTLALRAITKVTDAMRFVPAVQMKSSFGAFQEISVRGFYNTVYLIDGVRDERSTINSYPLGDLYNVDRLEVLKGPASVLYGYAATGGVVNITRRVPTDKFTLGAHIRGGSLGYFDLGAHVGGKIADGLNFYAGGFLSGGKQWRSTEDKNRSIFAALSYTKGVHSLILRLEGRNDFYGTDAGLPPVMDSDIYRVSDDKLYLKKGQLLPGLKRDWRYNDASDEMYNRAYNTSLKYTLSLPSNWKISDYLSYAYDDIDYFSTEELSYPTSDTAGEKYGYYTKDDSGTKTYYDLNHVQFTFPLRFEHIAKTLQNTVDLSGNFSIGSVKNNLRFAYSTTYLQRTSYTGYNGLDVQGGGRTFNAEGEVTNFSENTTYNPSFNGHMQTRLSKASPQHTWVHGFALSNVFEFSSQLKAMAAIRYDHYSYRHTSGLSIKDGKHSYDDVARDKYEKSSDDAISYRLGLVYQPMEAISFYTSLGSFYIPDKTTTLNTETQRFYDKDGQLITGRRGGSYFEPQSGYQFEVGTRYTLADVLQLNLSAYHIRRNNELASTYLKEQQKDGKSKEYDVVAQVGATEGNGFETDLTYRPLPGLELVVGYSYTDIHVADTKESPVTSLLNLREGTPMSWVPRKQFFTYGNYDFQRGALRNLSLNYSLSYRDAMYYNVGSALTFAPYTQLDLGASYRLPAGFSIAVQVRNVLNAENYTSVLNGTQFFPNEPTNALVTLSYKL